MWFERLAEHLRKHPDLLHAVWKRPSHQGRLQWRSEPTGDDLDFEIRHELMPRKTVLVSALTAIEGSGIAAEGFGTRVLAKSALTVSMAEAWERYLLHRMTLSPAVRALAVSWSKLSAGILEFESTELLTTTHSSNGFAAGATLAQAADGAAAEIFERHCVLTVWNHDARARKLAQHEPFWLAPAKVAGWHFNWYEVGRCHELITVACLARHPKLGARFDASAQATKAKAVASSTASVFRMIYEIRPDTMDFKTLWDAGEPMAHFAYYADPAHLHAFDFLDQGTHSQSTAHGPFKPLILPLWTPDLMPAVARAVWGPAKGPRWGAEAASLTPRNLHPHPIA